MGVDACRFGWVGVAVTSRGDRGRRLTTYAATTIDELADRACDEAPLDVLGIDIPVGLPDASRRRADLLAAAELGPRRSSVFLTPIREALAAPEYSRANQISRDRTGHGISAQAFGLRAKILEVDAWQATAGLPVFEVHPESSFAALSGGPLGQSKKTTEGRRSRRELLAGAGLHLADRDFPTGGGVAADDVLDAAAAAWTALRVAAGTARCLPDPPEKFSDGLPAAIWV
jgi:predicted RNase H-like nuclease